MSTLKKSLIACPKCKVTVLNETVFTTNETYLHCPQCQGHFKIDTQRFLTIRNICAMYMQHLN